MAKNDQKYQISLKSMAKRRVIKFGGAWNYNLVLKIWYHWQISNFGDGASFEHQNVKFGGQSLKVAKMAKKAKKQFKNRGKRVLN